MVETIFLYRYIATSRVIIEIEPIKRKSFIAGGFLSRGYILDRSFTKW